MTPPSQEHHQTAKEGRLPLKEKIGFVFGGWGTHTESRMYEIRDELKRRNAEEKAAEDAGALLASGGANA